MGLEPTTVGTTNRSSTVELRPPVTLLYQNLLKYASYHCVSDTSIAGEDTDITTNDTRPTNRPD